MNEEVIINLLSHLKHRIFPRPFERLAAKGKGLVGAEIGVYKGEHAESILRTLSIKKLYLIDPYELYEDYEEGKKHYGVDQDDLEKAEKEAKERLKEFSGKVEWVRKKASEVLNEIPNELDFVYIDGNHQFEFIREDIKNFFPKIKIGGVIGGHDMYNGFCFEHNGVVQAVIEFALKNNLQLYVEIPDWWVKKGKSFDPHQEMVFD